MKLRQRIGDWIAGNKRVKAESARALASQQARMYANARGTRSGGLGSSGNSSADAELSLSLTKLRSASRQMVRDSAYAKRAKLIVVNNVIGAGVGMQSQVMTTRGQLNETVNAAIEKAWCEWSCADSCHTGGALHFGDFERAAMGQVFEAGEVFIRKHYRRFGDSQIPLGLELIEAERVAADIVEPGAISGNGDIRMGVEVDEFQRPVAYWIRQRHPGDIRVHAKQTDRYERVPAADVFHLRLTDRWPQTRGEPWLHAVLKKFDDLNELTSSELSAVRASSYMFATIETPDGTPDPLTTAEDSDGAQVMDMEQLTIQSLAPGEKLALHSPNRPNPSLDAFLRAIVREMATGAMVSYESLSRDYSQSNYSSSRLALLDDRDTYKVLQRWWIRSFREPLHEVWLNQAVLARAIPEISTTQYAADMEKFEEALFKPRGWSWVDPTKEVNAYKEAIKAGMTTLTDVIAETNNGRDIEEVVKTRRRELDMLEAADIDVDTTVEDPLEVAAAKAPASAPAEDQPEDVPARVFSQAPKGLQ